MQYKTEYGYYLLTDVLCLVATCTQSGWVSSHVILF